MPEERDRVFYRFFYTDYQGLEERGVGDKMDGLDLQQKADEKKKPTEFQIPQKFLDFYMELENWMKKRQLRAKFCTLLVEADPNRESFLTNQQIYACFQKLGMKLSKKQVAQATYSLHQDQQGRFSYPELIELTCGRD